MRLADVRLRPIQQPNQNNAPQRGFHNYGSQYTDPDGAFTIEGVAPGDYYVTALAPGYIPESALLQAQAVAGAHLDDLLRQIPTVHVDADSTASVVVMVQRGGAIGGRVQWDDGSPAGSVQMVVQPQILPGKTLPDALPSLPGGNSPSSTVDDRGDFRIAGLAPGDYILSATILPEAHLRRPTLPIRIYSPGVFRRSEATPITVRAGGERTDLRIVLRLNGLRTVSGTVGAASGSAGVHSGLVTLTDSTDATLRLVISIATDGSFTLRYVPPGNYTMTVQGSSQEAPSGYRRVTTPTGDITTFAPLTQPLQVGSTDITGLAINLAPR